jgi:hypothetical protein
MSQQSKILRTLLWSAAAWLAAAPAAAGTLDLWENTHGAEDVTALFPTGVARTAHIVFNANSGEGGGVLDGVTGIRIEPSGSVVFTAFHCDLDPCVAGEDYTFTPGGAGTGVVFVNDWNSFGEIHGIHGVGTITFDGPQEPGAVLLKDCNYLGLDSQEHSCTPFMLARLPEPGRALSLTAGAALALGLRRRRTRQTRVSG